MSFTNWAITLIQKHIPNKKTGAVLGSVFLSFLGMKSTRLSNESPPSISVPDSSLSEVQKIMTKLRPQNLKSHGNNQSSWYYLLLCGVAFGAIGCACYYYRSRERLPGKKKPRKSTSRGSQPTRRRGFLNLSAKHCFANALLVCLIRLPGFKEKVCHEAALPNNKANVVLNRLANLFSAINQDRRNLSTQGIEASKQDFCNVITQSSPEIQVFNEKGGDSRSLFQILCENLPPNLQCFSFQQEKTVTCENCLRHGRQIIPKQFIESPFMLDIQEDSYFENNHYFPPQTELRTCKACGPMKPGRAGRPHRKQITLSKFPEVLAIRIGDTPHFEKEQAGPWLEIFLRKTEGGEQGYRFVGGVYNTMKGYEGSHSVAYVYKRGKEFLCYNDTDVRRVSFKEIKGYPKLMFYVKDPSEEVVLDVAEEKVSEGSVEESCEERNCCVDLECREFK